MPKISFGTKFSENELNKVGQFTRTYFQEKIPGEIPNSKITYEILNKYPGCLNLIKDNKKLIGFTFVLPCNKKIMNGFLNGEITEYELFKQINEQVSMLNYSTLYLCAALVKEAYRGKGIATSSFIRQIQIFSKKHNDLKIFGWATSAKGEKLIQRIEQKSGKKIRIKPSATLTF